MQESFFFLKVTLLHYYWHFANFDRYIYAIFFFNLPTQFLHICLFSTFQEIPKTPDYAPSRTFYLYTVNQLPTARMLLQNCYKVKQGAYGNLQSTG